ncbi:Pectinesterase inhibitor [Linum grandiflorum]
MTTSSLFLSIAVLLLSHVAADVHVTLAPPDIAAICAKSLDRGFCLNFLKTTPGISTADLKGAGLITLNAAGAEAAGTAKFINNLLGQPVDPKTKASYKSCLSDYGDAADNIAMSKASLNGGKYDDANIEASAAQENTDDCDEGVKGSELSKRNQHLFKVLEIVEIIANKLLGR